MGFDEGPARGRFECAVAVDCFVELAKSLAVLGNCEPRNDPGHEAKEVHDGTDIEERDARAFERHALDDEARALGGSPFDFDVTGRELGDRAHEELGEGSEAVRPDVLGEVHPARLQHTVDLVPPHHHGMAADHELEGSIREWQRGSVLRRVDEVRPDTA